jgi:hypothetical protein
MSAASENRRCVGRLNRIFWVTPQAHGFEIEIHNAPCATRPRFVGQQRQKGEDEGITGFCWIFGKTASVEGTETTALLEWQAHQATAVPTDGRGCCDATAGALLRYSTASLRHPESRALAVASCSGPRPTSCL